MNDRCAGGTGAVVDKIASRLGISPERLGTLRCDGLSRHSVAAKCGVFAETDIVALHRRGVPVEELMASLFAAIVRQNLSGLARGATIEPPVVLLGGPNAFIAGLRECWAEELCRLWAGQGRIPDGDLADEGWIITPEDAPYFAAIGAVALGRREWASGVRAAPMRAPTEPPAAFPGGSETDIGLVRDATELRKFIPEVTAHRTAPATWRRGVKQDIFLGIDAGSTTTKAVALDAEGRMLAKAYRFSRGNPVRDVQEVIEVLAEEAATHGATLNVLAVGVTGYARDILRPVVGADQSVVETVAHMRHGLSEWPHADVICDVGGQDIKVIFLRDGAVYDFRLNSQCAAGNGYYLQSAVANFGHTIEQFADIAFTARRSPRFSHGCAVFLQSEIVDFQRRGWRPNEILAGLARVLPRNIWLHVCQMPNPARLGRTFVLQGGVQRNLAAVKAQIDYIRQAFNGTGEEPNVHISPHCGEAGAIGCALEVRRAYLDRPFATAFVGFDALAGLESVLRRESDQPCLGCLNACLRPVFEVVSKTGVTRVSLGPCEREAGRTASAKEQEISAETLDLSALAACEVFQLNPAHGPARSRGRLKRRGLPVRVGLPRALDMYALAPFFNAWFMDIGLASEQIVWSEITTGALFRDGAHLLSIDPCFPSKLALAHAANLASMRHSEHALTHLFLPAIDSLPTWLEGVQASRTCPTAAAAGEAAQAALARQGSMLADQGVCLKKTFLNLHDPDLCAGQMWEDWRDELGISRREARHAVDVGLRALEAYQGRLRDYGRRVLERVEREQRPALVLLARPCHNDPGINHGIPEAFRRKGFPVLTIESLPLDGTCPLNVDDIWKNAYSENGSRKLWAAKYAAHHPWLFGLELSSFKCGHDAPIYSAIQEILESAGKPLFRFRDLDENNAAATIAIRVETFAYALERFARSRREGLAAWSEIREDAESRVNDPA
jgi:activator of 2-hydroxyglutaryl-CoA dehydratase/predicted nucleotide-binding protein (sugar kinase/HSP70/actin superfamily)